MSLPSPARIAGTVWCSAGAGGDPGNRVCDNVALPGYDLCPVHERIMNYLEKQAAEWAKTEEAQ